jgi:hypothetical protein
MDDQPGATGATPAPGAEVRHVPATGIDVWAAPDPSQPPVGSIAGGTAVTVVGRRGQWVHVQAEGGIDAWVDGSALAGIAVGASATAAPVSPAAEPTERTAGGPVVVEKQRGPFTVGTGPVIGAFGAVVAIVGAALPWLQNARHPGAIIGESFSAFDIPLSFLSDWKNLGETGFSLGALIVIVAAVALVLSLVAGGGIIRRILGGVLVIVAVVYVLQWQDYLSSGSRGLGTGLNVWDIVDYGVLLTFGGGVAMILAPSR